MSYFIQDKLSTNKISLTFDIDWAPDEVIEFCLEPIIKSSIPCTIFCTHFSEYLSSVFKSYSFIEAAIHPNFVPLINGESSYSFKKIIDDLLDLYPNAIGARSHGHVVSSSIIQYYIDRGLIYESGIYAPRYNSNLPIYYADNFLRIPHLFQDDAHLMRNLSFDSVYDSLDGTGFKVFDFHPVHVFLNTFSIEHYQQAKFNYHDSKKLSLSRNIKNIGVFDFYKKIISYLQEHIYEAASLASIANQLLSSCHD